MADDRCSLCGSVSYVAEFKKAFNVIICPSCKREGGAELISRTNAKQARHLLHFTCPARHQQHDIRPVASMVRFCSYLCLQMET